MHDEISVLDERKTSRSQEISVNFSSSSDRTGRLGIDTVAVQADLEVYHVAEMHNVDYKTRCGRIEEDMHGLQNSRTTTFHCETRAKYQCSTIHSEN